jgi:hypothetical protein
MTVSHLRVFIIILFSCTLVASCTCGDDDDNDSTETNDDVDDDSGDDDLNDDSDDDDDESIPQYLIDRPFLNNWSSWYQQYDRSDPVSTRDIGGFGIGNGRIFSMVACKAPFTTLHNIAGPNYQRHTKFFSDKRFFLYRDGFPVAWENEYAYRVRNSAIIVIRQDAGDLSLWTIDFAPRGDGIDGTDLHNTLARIFVVHNRGVFPVSGLSLVMETVMGRVENGLVREAYADELDIWGVVRRMAGGFVDQNQTKTKSDKSLEMPVGTLQSGAEFSTEFLMAFNLPGDALPIFEEASQVDSDTLLNATYDWWMDFTGQGARIETSSERFDDLIDAATYVLHVQVSDQGAPNQMSEYTGIWLRDMMGPARYYPLLGRVDDFKDMIDYYWLCALEAGSINNSFSVDTQFTPGQEQPDWENLPVMGGRSSAESPSYLILHYKAYLDATGDWAPLEERYGMLRHALIHQNIREGCLLPFSGDETFRPALAVAFGQWIFDEYADSHLSANSSFLFVAAAEFLTDVAAHFGYAEHEEEFRDLADDFRACAEERYWLEDKGYYTPIIDIDTLEPDDRPYEDVNTQALWCGYLRADDPKARENMVNTWEMLGREDGMMFTPPAPSYDWMKILLGFDEGVVTGMNYGYTLDNLARIDHPMAEKAFTLYEDFFHTCGSVSEGQIVDDFSRFMYLYEPIGAVSDLTARFRSWEGGINAAAQIQYLFGLELDARQNRIAIAPHLPTGWEFAAIDNAMLADNSFDLRVEDDGQTRRVIVESEAAEITVDAIVSIPGQIQSVTVGGETVEPEIESEWGRSRAKLPGLTAAPEQLLEIEVVYSDEQF